MQKAVVSRKFQEIGATVFPISAQIEIHHQDGKIEVHKVDFSAVAVLFRTVRNIVRFVSNILSIRKAKKKGEKIREIFEETFEVTDPEKIEQLQQYINQ